MKFFTLVSELPTYHGAKKSFFREVLGVQGQRGGLHECYAIFISTETTQFKVHFKWCERHCKSTLIMQM